MMRKRLYATGFNAWGQISKQKFQDGADEAVDANAHADHANLDLHDDLVTLQNVLEDDDILGVYSFLSYTIVKTSSGMQTAGWIPRDHGKFHRDFPELIFDFAQSLDGTIVARDAVERRITKYPSMTDWASAIASSTPTPRLPGCADVVQIAAYHAGFVALTSSGRVWTFGDERYGACLGREVTAESPAHEPHPVIALDDLPTGPIVKIAAGGYLLAALTAGNDLYCWGGHPGLPPVIPDVSAEPQPVVVVGADGQEREIKDVGVGEMHLIVLTTDGEVFVAGSKDCQNGQLGLGHLQGSSPDGTPWIKLDLENKVQATGVAAGPRTSFLIAQFDTHDA